MSASKPRSRAIVARTGDAGNGLSGASGVQVREQTLKGRTRVVDDVFRDGMRRLALTALAATTLACVPALAAETTPGTPTAPAADPPKPKYVKLSNETTFTRWAYTNLTVKIKRSPSSRSKTVGKLHFNTEDKYPEIYIALRQYTNGADIDWVQIRIPGRPNGRKGWVPREGLGEFHLIHTQLVVDRRRLRATLYKNGKRIFKAPVGVGKASTPTPGGRFWIRERLSWSARYGDVYGPLAFGTAAYSTKLTDWPGGGVVGVHGTNQPQLVPGRPSHGCIRMHNGDIKRLARLMKPGTPLLIK
jgi:lipoprotein-anchoring transpeptidase ErfK/SrfK